jgi:hypothetical protein
MRKYREYSDEDVINYSKHTYSIAQLLKKLDLMPTGGNYYTMKRLLQKLKVNTSHWKGQAWSKGQQLKDWSKYSSGVKSFRKHLLKERDFKCESCNRKTWNKKQIPLEIHHVDGDRTNNKLDNLKVLCCNCHATTETWRKPKF